MSAVLQNSMGKIIYSEDFISVLAGIYTTDCYGIVGMTSKRATDGLVELIKGENLKKGVKVYSEGNRIKIELFVIVEYGVSVGAVAENVIDAVKYNVEKLTGLIVNKVNITVNGIRV